MKYIIPILVFSLLVSVLTPVFPVSAKGDSTTGPIWLAATPGISPTAPKTQVSEIDMQTMDVTFTFSGVWAEVQTSNGQSFTRLWHEDYSSYREPGQPALPGTTFNLLIPGGAQVEVMQRKVGSHVVSLSQKKLPKMILPAQVQGTKSEPPPPWTPPDPHSYASQTATPESWYEIKDTFQLRDYTILPLWINPVRYEAVSGEIELLEKIELRLTWPKLAVDTFNTKPKTDSPSFDRLVSQIVINPPELSMDYTKAETGEGYLIIAPDEFVDELASFVQMKEVQGFSVSTTKLSDIDAIYGNHGVSSIQNYIKSLESTPVYLLLAGDTNLIPAPSGNITNKKTDLYYATMDADFVPDIYVGRIPARSESDVTIMVNKMRDYTNNGYQTWHSNAAFIATCDLKNFPVAEGSHNYVIAANTAPLGFPSYFPILSPPPGGDQLYCISYSATESDIFSSINSKRGLITYSGHGSAISWADFGIMNEELDQFLLSNDAFSFVSSFACQTNDFGSTYYQSVFGETWMLLENKGSIAFLGSSADTQWGQDDILEKAFYDSIFENPINPNPLREALFYGLSQVQVNYPGTALYQAQYYWEAYNLLGDPSQKLWLVPDYKFEATTPEETKNGLITNTVKYPIEITNLGNIDSYSATLSDNIWFSETSLVNDLPYQASDTLWVSVTIPEGVTPGSTDTVQVIVSSTNDPTQTFSITFTTTALETFFTRFPLIFK
ncbi:MAG: C25 family cysteine peptidase [Anaerolineaceae bacterium]|nr:C25 family cysteine peptidase [Anaerolineaceae bacterium]